MMDKALGSYTDVRGSDSQEGKSDLFSFLLFAIFFSFFSFETFRGFVYYQLGSALVTQNLNPATLRT